MNLKRLPLACSAVVFLFAAISLTAQGNLEMKGEYGPFNARIKTDLESFKTDISVKYKIPKTKLELMLSTGNMEPSDVYLSAELSLMSNKDIDTVIDAYKADKGGGWGVIAKSLGIKPGSAQFHELKMKMNRMKTGQDPDASDEVTTKGKGKGKGRGKAKGKY